MEGGDPALNSSRKRGSLAEKKSRLWREDPRKKKKIRGSLKSG